MSEQASAADLIEQAKIAESDQELDEIEAQANGRTTVLSAVNERRAQLQEQQQTEFHSPEQPHTEQTEVIDDTGAPPAPVHGSLGESPGGDPGDPQAHLQIQTPEQVDPPLGPYPDPPKGPYPDPVRKVPQEPTRDRDHPDADREPVESADRGPEPDPGPDPTEPSNAG
jgi:hypothetical protein